jgi:adsorption protein B
MEWGGPILTSLDVVVREAALFAAAGFLVLGAGDLLVDGAWLVLRFRRGRKPLPRVADLPAPRRSGWLAVFIPAWDESAVIGDMLRNALRVWGSGTYRLYVGCYPNDPATIAAVAAVDDARVRMVVGPAAGPTTKADCLNRLWEALVADEGAGEAATAIILHDAEDLVPPEELRVFATVIEDFDFVQLPVRPLIDRDARWVGGHYADEFAEAHGKEMPVRQWLGAGLPSAGVGCAFSRAILGRIADAAPTGLPFDAASLTEDYELGLKVREAGGTSLFLQILGGDGRVVATQEYFPGTVAAAVAQKARWMTGIALAGWDRMGWNGGLAERWMRLRDRQSLLAAALLFAGYFSAGLGLLLAPLHWITAPAAPLPPLLTVLLQANFVLLAWRTTMRAAFACAAYGWREAVRSVPRAIVGNAIAMVAAGAALLRYRRLRRTGQTIWGKTAHMFPTTAAAE